ncbi:hypothetical protein N7468_008375 [Penicillium chermesinum]|uniref:Kinetochore protein fta7 n=1 Tax=Penicillium chermesinum TaxID=63820 RepID=A0A9W9TIE1_9EURO|nr:uncharacterized protein N7468_008375 [Penicillium chermesinum]KAJ5223833.1 hypothetical protein N7468_008375 [Penicillium chermesinum]
MTRRATPKKHYAYLKPSVRRVPEKTIKSKWATLPEPVQDKVRGLFHAIERPVIMRHSNEKKRIEAQAAVHAVVRNLGKRLPRMPFPPITKDAHFDYESALDEHRLLAANIATMRDSTALLKAEIAREEALLAEEKKALQEMDKNAKRAEAERKRLTKNEHPVLRQLDEFVSSHDATDVFALADGKTPRPALGELDADPEIQGLMKQLHGHLQSMQTNIAPLAGLSDAVTRSQAALDLYSSLND